ncbi:centlein-like [Amphiura filiformis]|uniref:centlein-like n=1 Tax=Amphiura filiformis TaxID=82378 RepID=UPI003B216C3E
MATADDPRFTRLQAENKALADELAQCQADKEFVWTLWKRLQVANPDVTQAISLVVQREKEKAELKDRKILEILHVKDGRIVELEQVLSQHQDEVKALVARKLEVDDEKAALLEENQLLKQQNDHLKQQNDHLKNKVESTVLRLGSTESVNKQLIDKFSQEKKDTETKASQLTIDLEKLQQDLKESQEIKGVLDIKIKSLEKELRKAQSSSEKTEKQLTEEEDQLHQTQESLLQIKAELKARENELKSARKELSGIQSSHSQTLDQAAGQADIIRQLQTLQIDTQKVLKNQEDAHKLEVSSFQAMYKELQSRHNATKTSEEQLKHRMTKLQKDLAKAEKQLQYRPDVRNVSIQVDMIRRTESVEKRDTEVLDMAWDIQARGRRAASTPVKSSARRARSLSPRMLSHRPPNTRPPVQGSSHTRDDMDIQRNQMDGDDIISSSPDEAQMENVTSHDSRDRKLSDLRKLLKLKNQELEEMRRAHNRRHERLKVLQSSHNLLREQIKTYEAHESVSGKQKKKKARRSTDPKALQRENSEAVWNDLAYYKQQHADLLQERMNLEEELDCLKVQTASDATTIEELNKCLQQERQDLHDRLSQLKKVNKREEREREIIEELKRKIKSLKHDKEDLHTQIRDTNIERTVVEKEIRVLKKETSQLRAESSKKDSNIYTLKKYINTLRKKLRHRHRHTVGSVPLSRSPQQHQAFLNRSIQDMSEIFPDFDKEGWQEISSTDSSSSEVDDVVEGSSSSLGQKIVSSSSNTSTPKKKGHKRTRRNPKNVSPRQLASIENHLMRMARAYEEQQTANKEDNSTSVATQTDRVSTIRVKDAGVGDLLIGDIDTESTSTNSETSDSKTPRRIKIAVDRRTIATSPHISLSKLSHSISRKACQSSGTHSVSSLKQRLMPIQSQVAVLREAKLSLQKTTTEQCEQTDKLQEDLNLANQRLKMSKQTVQRLQSELQQCEQEKRSCEIQLEAKKTESDAIRHSETAWKQMENRIKSQSGEVGRQTAVIKALKSDNDSQRESVKSMQDKINRMERDISQKRSLIEDLKAKATAAEMRSRSEAQNTGEVEEKLQYVSEQLDRKKAEIESLRKQLGVVTNEKHQYEEQWVKTQAELSKKNHLVHEANVRCNEAESTATELESAASHQMMALAKQTESALQAANEKLKKSRKQADELEIFVKELAAEILRQVQESRLLLKQSVQAACIKRKETLRVSMNSRAQSIASDLLHMSASDLEEFLTDDTEDDEERFEQEKKDVQNEKQDRKWTKRLTALLESKGPSSDDLLRLFIGKISEKDSILKQLR